MRPVVIYQFPHPAKVRSEDAILDQSPSLLPAVRGVRGRHHIINYQRTRLTSIPHTSDSDPVFHLTKHTEEQIHIHTRAIDSRSHTARSLRLCTASTGGSCASARCNTPNPEPKSSERGPLLWIYDWSLGFCTTSAARFRSLGSDLRIANNYRTYLAVARYGASVVRRDIG